MSPEGTPPDQAQASEASATSASSGSGRSIGLEVLALYLGSCLIIRLIKEAVNAIAGALHKVGSYADADQSQLSGTNAAAQQARVQIEMPNGEKLDLSEIQLLQSRMIGDRDTHILNLKGVKLGGTWKMPKIIGKL